jgi:hypothetical protein
MEIRGEGPIARRNEAQMIPVQCVSQMTDGA